MRQPKKAHAAPVTVIESSVATITINHLGARISSLLLHNFKVRVGASEPLNLISHQAGEALPLGVYYYGTFDGIMSTTRSKLSMAPFNQARMAHLMSSQMLIQNSFSAESPQRHADTKDSCR